MAWDFNVPGIPDEYFIRGKVPMTKEEVRAVTISKMRLKRHHRVLDIGSGTGSITIEAALIAREGRVTGIERNADGVALLKENMKQFGVENIESIHGSAPKDLPDGRFDAIVIGGTGGNMEVVLDYCGEHLESGGRVVINLVTVENLYKSMAYLKESEQFKDLDMAQVAVSKARFVKNITMMDAHNPIFIVSATRV